MSAAISVTLPLPPTTNRAYRVVNNRAVKSREARDYETTVSHELQRQGVLTGLHYESTDALRLELRIGLFLKFDRDVDSCKVLQDCLAWAFQFNDKQILRLVIDKQRDKANPRAEVTLRVMGEGL